MTTCAPSSPPAGASASWSAPRRPEGGPETGDVVAGRYRIESPLGHGAMGAVYRATRLSDAAAVAIKLMHPRLTRDESVARRFDREVAVATRLDHRNCVRVLEGGTTEDGTKFLVMPLLHGVELRQRLAGPMPAGWVVDIVGQVLRGLDHAHRLGFVHRDVKPENVFIVRDADGSDVAQLLDFGLVKLLDPVSGAVPLTREGLVFGTPAYMSPEQAAGQRIDARADLYGVGVMMYEMLSGAQPFQADEAVVLLRRQMLADPPALPPEVPASLAAFVMRLLEKNPRDRFASATEALVALADAARGRLPTRGVSAPVASPSPAELSWHAAARSEAGSAPSASLIRTTATEQRAFAIVALLMAVLAGGLWAVLRGEPEVVTTAPARTPASAAAMSSVATPTQGAASEATAPTSPEEPIAPVVTPTPAPESAKTEPPPASTEPAPAKVEPAPKQATPKKAAAPKSKKKTSKPKTTAPARPSGTTKPTTPEPDPTTPRVLRTDRPPRTPAKASKLPTASTRSKIPARRLVPRTS